MERIDLNCDLGEGCGSDAELMPFITSANVACGGHAGDADTMRRTVELAMEHGVAVGAHPGYEDRENFGRIPRQLTVPELRMTLMRQLDALQNVAGKLGARLQHVKPHGAMYNQAAADRELAGAIARIVAEWDKTLILVGLSGSFSISEATSTGLRTAAEAFGDRHYDSNGRLVPRSSDRALITDPDGSVTRVLDVVRYGRVRSVDGVMVRVDADTICLHGDGVHAVEMAWRIHSALSEAGILIAHLNA